MKKIELHIPDMHSVHCQTRVTKILQQIEGVAIEQVLPRSVTLFSNNQEVTRTVIKLIDNAGYKVSEVSPKSLLEIQSSFNMELHLNAFLSL